MSKATFEICNIIVFKYDTEVKKFPQYQQSESLSIRKLYFTKIFDIKISRSSNFLSYIIQKNLDILEYMKHFNQLWSLIWFTNKKNMQIMSKTETASVV